MKVSNEDYEQLRSRIEEMKSERDQATGAVNELRKRLKETHGVTSKQEAQELLTRLTTKRGQLKLKLDRAEAEFQAKYEDQL